MNVTQWLRNQWDRGLAVALAGAGLLAILLGWWGLSDEALPSQQIPYLASGGVLGIFLLGAGATMWLSADMRDEWRVLKELSTKVDLALDLLQEDSAPEPIARSTRRTAAPRSGSAQPRRGKATA